LTLLDLSYPQEFRAPKGTHGKGKNQTGRNGEDRIIRVPVGTVVREDQTGEVLQDLILDGQSYVAAVGGRGGRGNTRFATATRQTPRYAEKGEPGQEGWLRLELKLLADVGLLGFPNAGKSTLLARISSAKPKIGDYPFTTLSPNLGVVMREGHRPIVVADIPGMIEGASKGAGLGLTFLRHVERTRLLVHLLDISGERPRDPLQDFQILNAELSAYHAALVKKPQIVTLNKIDLPEVRSRASRVRERLQKMGYRVVLTSGQTGEGIDELMNAVTEALESMASDPPVGCQES
jgi:GTP-binding protein